MSSKIEVGEGAPVAEPERTTRLGSINCSPREVVRACARGGEVRALGRRGIHGGGGLGKGGVWGIEEAWGTKAVMGGRRR